jgi:glycosyltransferase involved in cell wall biosynthesis
VAYLTSHYPFPSHVFIEREISGLRALGVDVETFSVRRTPPEGLLSNGMRVESRTTLALLEDKPAILRALGRLTASRPGVAASVLTHALSLGDRGPRARLWQAFYLAEAVRLHEELSRLGLRHVHVHLANNAADVARLVVALGRAIDGPASDWRWTLTMHGPTEFEAVERFDLAAKVRSAAAVACISDFTRSQLMRLVEPSEWAKLSVVRMSVDLDAYPARTSYERAGRPFRVLSVGRLVPEKGAPVLLDALAELHRRGIEVRARLVGAGPLEGPLRAQVAALGLDRIVELVGAVGQDSLPDHYAWADAFCLPSFQEGLPVVLMEAMASGLPVVTTRIAGIPEMVVDGRHGRVVTPGRADHVAKALGELADSPDRCASFGQGGRRAVEAEFSTSLTALAQVRFLTNAQDPSPVGSPEPKQVKGFLPKPGFA